MKTSALRVDPDRPFRWRDHDPADRCGFENRADAEKQLAADVAKMIELQDVFFADARYGLLIIIQGVDAAGKDGIVKHVMSGLNPMGVNVYSFRAPSAEERAHDYLWRSSRLLPPRGRIAIFNRSYYEEVLVCRVHPEFIDAERLPPNYLGPTLWRQRFEQMVDYERYLVHQGITVLKFFLHLSREEQLERLLERIHDPDKNWKFSPSDLETPQHWHKYRDAYDEVLLHTSSHHAPWYVIPADRKWVARLAVANIVVDHLKKLDLQYPKMRAPDLERLAQAKTYIEGEMVLHGAKVSR